MEKKKYLTRGVNEKIPLAVQLVRWELASALPSEKQDYVYKITLIISGIYDPLILKIIPCSQ